MKIIIVGNGKVGFAIAQTLSQEGHDITIVDENVSALRRSEGTLDVLCMEGNGASISVLIEAGVRTADLVIAVTSHDETNLVCCLIAKKLGAGHTIARVRNTDYRRDAEMLKREIGMDMVINPDRAAAQEIAHILSFPAAFSAEPFARGILSMIGVQLTEEDAICGRPLKEQRQRPAETLICAAQRGDEFIIPNGEYTPTKGDKIYMVGSSNELQKMLRYMGRTWNRVKDVSILGGSRTAMYLTWALQHTGCRIRIVEKDPARCQVLSAELPQAVIILGDGADNTLLMQENILDADAFVAVTNRDEDNLLMAMHAQRSGVGKVLAKMTRPNYMDLVASTGIESIISPKDIVATQITSYVRALGNAEGSKVETLYKLLGGEVEALSFTATATAQAMLGKPLKDLKLRRSVLLAAIVRRSEIIIPGGMTTIEEGDQVVVVSRSIGLDDLTDILA
jgi:trk system potassium uptake protein TrkA